jgi:hypothetical protein
MSPTATLQRKPAPSSLGSRTPQRVETSSSQARTASSDGVVFSSKAAQLMERSEVSPTADMKDHRRLMAGVEEAYEPHLEAVLHQMQAESEVSPALKPEERKRFQESMAEELSETAEPPKKAVDQMVEHAGQPGFAENFGKLSPEDQAEFLTNAGQVFPDTEKGQEWVSGLVDGLADPDKENPFAQAASELMQSDLPDDQKKKLEASLSWMIATDSSHRLDDIGVSQRAQAASEAIGVSPEMAKNFGQEVENRKSGQALAGNSPGLLSTALDMALQQKHGWAISGVGMAADVAQGLELPASLTSALGAVGSVARVAGQARAVLGGGMALVELASGENTREALGDLMTNVGAGALAFGATGGAALASGGLALAGLALKYGPQAFQRSPYHEFVEDHLMESGISDEKHRAVMTGFGVQGGLEQIQHDAERTGLEPWQILEAAIDVRSEMHPRGSGTYYAGGGPWDYINSGYGEFYYERALKGLTSGRS